MRNLLVAAVGTSIILVLLFSYLYTYVVGDIHGYEACLRNSIRIQREEKEKVCGIMQDSERAIYCHGSNR